LLHVEIFYILFSFLGCFSRVLEGFIRGSAFLPWLPHGLAATSRDTLPLGVDVGVQARLLLSHKVSFSWSLTYLFKVIQHCINGYRGEIVTFNTGIEIPTILLFTIQHSMTMEVTVDVASVVALQVFRMDRDVGHD
jgi:uncharacterized membrane protein